MRFPTTIKLFFAFFAFGLITAQLCSLVGNQSYGQGNYFDTYQTAQIHFQRHFSQITSPSNNPFGLMYTEVEEKRESEDESSGQFATQIHTNKGIAYKDALSCTLSFPSILSERLYIRFCSLKLDC